MKIHTQAELTANIDSGEVLEIVAAGVFALTLMGTAAPHIVVNTGVQLSIVSRESSAPRIESRGSSAPRIESWGSSAPSIVSRESSAPSIVSRGSSAPSIESWGSSAPSIESWGSSAPRIESWGSSAPSIESRESSAPSIESRESSAPSIVSWGSSAPSIESRGSSAPRIESRESSAAFVDARSYARVLIRGSVLVNATPNVSVVAYGKGWKVEGVEPKVVDLSTPAAWCDYYGVTVTNGIAMVYKAVNDDFRSPRGTSYAPGTIPVAPDWDGGKKECGLGLHYSPSPAMAREFHPDAKRYLACPVALADISVHPDGDYPQKIKARGCAAPTFEVNYDGEPIEVAQ